MNIDLLFAGLFSSLTVVAAIALTVVTAQLPNEERNHVLDSTTVSGTAISIFYVLMMVPMVCFSLKHMTWTALSIILMASVLAFCLSRMTNRINVILRQRGYC